MVERGFVPAGDRRDLWHGEDIDALLAWLRENQPMTTNADPSTAREDTR